MSQPGEAEGPSNDSETYSIFAKVCFQLDWAVVCLHSASSLRGLLTSRAPSSQRRDNVKT